MDQKNSGSTNLLMDCDAVELKRKNHFCVKIMIYDISRIRNTLISDRGRG